mgnify:CR=1 FL=1|jgi:hypothetical protein|tara:strand:+ start:57 stop:572 length:516 start_codon:yes stop_codon:yes gene_type:complete
MDFKDKFYKAVNEAYDPEANIFSQNDFRFAETQRGEDSPTGKTRIVLNHNKLKKSGAGTNYVNEMLIGEGLHLIKDIDPARANRLYDKAINDPPVLNWLKESYKREQQSNDEKRSFDKWVKTSRLDQIIGGYLLGGSSSSIPTMKAWPVDKLPYGTEFKKELDILKVDLDL